MQYLVTFDPENRFFFGAAHGYADTYLVRSQKIPPLSTVLGTIRKALLLQEKLLVYQSTGKRAVEGIAAGKSVEDLKAVIGDFDYSKKQDGGLGKIKRISPVFLVCKEGMKIYYPLPLNWQCIDEIPVRREIAHENILNNFAGGKSESFPYLNGYIAKCGLCRYWAEASVWKDIADGNTAPNSGGAQLLTDEDIFVEHKHPGIDRGGIMINGRKEYTQSAQGQSYFQKIDYSFSDDAFAFGVLLDLNDDTQIPDGGVEMGGDRSFFHMTSTQYPCIPKQGLLQSLVTPLTKLDANSRYAILSETNISSFRNQGFICLNGGELELLRRMVLQRNASVSAKPFRLRMKSGTYKSMPIGSIIITGGKETAITPGFSQAAGFDRFIKLQ